jgi:hypothetical protein
VAFAASARTSSFDLTVTTADGDRVTISSSTTELLGGVAVEGRDASGGAGASASESSFSVSVEGTLDRDELRDLRKLAKVLRRAAEGHDIGKLARRLSRPDMESIASVSASSSESVVMVAGVLTLGPSGFQTPRPTLLN